MMSSDTENEYRGLPPRGTKCIVKFNAQTWMGEGSAIAEVKGYDDCHVLILAKNFHYTTERIDNVRFYHLPKEMLEAQQ